MMDRYLIRQAARRQGNPTAHPFAAAALDAHIGRTARRECGHRPDSWSRSRVTSRAIRVRLGAAHRSQEGSLPVTHGHGPREPVIRVCPAQGEQKYGGQGRGRTADLPLFRSKDHCLGAAMFVVWRGQRHPVPRDRPPCTGINETTNETTPSGRLSALRAPTRRQRRGDLLGSATRTQPTGSSACCPGAGHSWTGCQRSAPAGRQDEHRGDELSLGELADIG